MIGIKKTGRLVEVYFLNKKLAGIKKRVDRNGSPKRSTQLVGKGKNKGEKDQRNQGRNIKVHNAKEQ